MTPQPQSSQSHPMKDMISIASVVNCEFSFLLDCAGLDRERPNFQRRTFIGRRTPVTTICDPDHTLPRNGERPAGYNPIMQNAMRCAASWCKGLQ